MRNLGEVTDGIHDGSVMGTDIGLAPVDVRFTPPPKSGHSRNPVWPRQYPRVSYLPLKIGDRFSLNEVIPSRRSSVGMVL